MVSRLHVREFGDPSGKPVLHFHGWPSSATDGALFDDAAKRHGIRLIAMDRPGMGASPPNPPETALPDFLDSLTALQDSLGIARCPILALSGGTPYALACAALRPARVSSLTIVSGAPPLLGRIDSPCLHPAYRALLRLWSLDAGMVQQFLMMQEGLYGPVLPQFIFAPLLRLLPDADRRALNKTSFAIIYQATREAFQQSGAHVYEDALIHVRPLPFGLEQIKCPVAIWHGTEDKNFEISLWELPVSQLASCQFHRVEGEGHFSLPANQADAIFGGESWID